MTMIDLFTPYSDLLKYSPNHDERGRFSSGGGSGTLMAVARGKKPRSPGGKGSSAKLNDLASRGKRYRLKSGLRMGDFIQATHSYLAPGSSKPSKSNLTLPRYIAYARSKGFSNEAIENAFAHVVDAYM